MKRPLGNSLSWSFLLLAASAFATPSCTPTERTFENTGGAAGSGGAGGEGGSNMVCTPNVDQQPCYTGPQETLEVGVCRGGTAICLPSGAGFGECAGEVVPAGENCLTPEDEACNGTNAAECPVLGNGWLQTFGSLGATQTVNDVAVTNTGDIVAVGTFTDTIDFGLGPMASTGSTDIFVAKFDPMGKAIWSKRFGDASSQSAASVAVDSMGAIYVTGTMQGSVDFEGKLITSAGSDDAYLVRFEPDGTPAWARVFGDISRQNGRRVAVSKTNLVIIAGEFSSAIQFDAAPNNMHTAVGGVDIFVARFDASGFVSGSRGFGSMASDTVRGLRLDASDQVYLTGAYDTTIDFDGQMLTSTGGRDAYLAILAPNLAPNKALGFGFANGPTSFQEGNDIAFGPNGELFLTGGFTDSIEIGGKVLNNVDTIVRTMFLAQLDGMFNATFAQQYGGIGGSIVDTRLAFDSAATQLVMAGSFTGDADFGGGLNSAANSSDPFMVKLGLDGTFLAARTLQNAPMTNEDDNLFTSLALLPSGDLVVGGILRSPVAYDPTVVGEEEIKFGNALLGRFIH